MAIIRSHSVAGGKKSAGMITYRHTKGRVIASQKRGSSEKSKEAFMGVNNALCNAFALCQLFSKMHAASIDVAFEATKYGTPRNKFTKLNMTAFRGIAAAIKSSNPTIVDGKYIVTPDDLDSAVATYCTANPTAMYRVFKSGYETAMNTGAWNDNLELTPIAPSSNFKVAVIVSPSAGGSVAGAGRFEPNTPCTLTATAASGYRFGKYVLADNTEVTANPYQFTVSGNTTIRAVFDEVHPVLTSIRSLGYDDLTDSLTIELVGNNMPASDTVTVNTSPRMSNDTSYTYTTPTIGGNIGKHVVVIENDKKVNGSVDVTVTYQGVSKIVNVMVGSDSPVLS